MTQRLDAALTAARWLGTKEGSREHRELLDEVALYLLAKETITGEELMKYVNAYIHKDEAPATE